MVQVDRLEEPSQEPDQQKQPKQEQGPQVATDAHPFIGNEAYDDYTKHTHTHTLGNTYTHSHTHTHPHPSTPRPTTIP